MLSVILLNAIYAECRGTLGATYQELPNTLSHSFRSWCRGIGKACHPWMCSQFHYLQVV